MGHRLTRIYTRTGDQGETGLADGTRISKNAPRICLQGELDELNSYIGFLLTLMPESKLVEPVMEIQHLLFELGGDLSQPGRNGVGPESVQWLESWLDHLNEELPPLREFILPGGSQVSAVCHLARTVCRRAERVAVGLAESEALSPGVISFLNRLSDLLFVVGRILNRPPQEGGVEPLWQHDRKTPWPPGVDSGRMA